MPKHGCHNNAAQETSLVKACHEPLKSLIVRMLFVGRHIQLSPSGLPFLPRPVVRAAAVFGYRFVTEHALSSGLAKARTQLDLLVTRELVAQATRCLQHGTPEVTVS